MSSKSKVYFFFNKQAPILDRRKLLKKRIEDLFKKEGKILGSLNYIFCSDNELLKINRQYLNHDYFTDIITFNLSEDQSIIGEVYISIERVRDNAKNLNVSIKSELLRVIIHGALHLCGYLDKTVAEKKLMRQLENQYLAKLG